MTIRLVIVDEEESWCASVGRYLTVWKELAVTGIATNHADALRIIGVRQPQVVLLDMNLAVNCFKGISLLTQISDRHSCQIILLSTSFMDVEQVKEAIMAGAVYCMLKSDYQGLPGIIQNAPLLDVFVTDYRRLWGWFKRQELLKELTPAELELVGHLESDKPLPQIAAELFKSEKTLRNQLTDIFHKLNVKNRKEVIEKLNKELQLY